MGLKRLLTQITKVTKSFLEDDITESKFCVNGEEDEHEQVNSCKSSSNKPTFMNTEKKESKSTISISMINLAALPPSQPNPMAPPQRSPTHQPGNVISIPPSQLNSMATPSPPIQQPGIVNSIPPMTPPQHPPPTQ
ncbi:probable pectinesterase/pectinesterase inhibitor 47 [Lactuca sativa]|uniref:probable pectinesterase/pectinesterase inhibitor 47 n=1 Tax=Lactuca sativa TaxID=4236 RepID=UPI0022AE66FC|nr:probable pectinesterase/pectinesterase inhibitor 47 [Lactuca sativa]